MSKIRVVHLIESLGVGGAERRLVSDLRWFNRDRYDHRVIYLTPDDTLRGEIEAIGIPTQWLGMRHLRDWQVGIFRLAALLRQWRPHLVHTQVFGADLYGRLASAMAKVPLVLSTIQTVPYDQRLARFYSKKRWLADRVTARLYTHHFIAVSEAVRGTLLDRFGVPPSRVHVIPNGVDLTRLSPQPSWRTAVRAELGLAEEQFVVLSVGRLIPEKDHATLLQAFRLTVDRLPQARLLLAGDGPLREQLERSLIELKLQGRVRFLGTRLDVDRLYQAADLFVLSSLREGLPVSLLEAMACEVPVIASAIPQHREVIKDGAMGRLFSPQQPQRLAEAIRDLLQHPLEAKQMAQQARTTVVERFSAQAVAQQLQKLYDGLCLGDGSHA